ncbi:MAG: hypothetical protein Q4E56_04405 [Pseudomonadota bacterium]|nr:hypothetical protein [Pseudomonadota bacterium]
MGFELDSDVSLTPITGNFNEYSMVITGTAEDGSQTYGFKKTGSKELPLGVAPSLSFHEKGAGATTDYNKKMIAHYGGGATVGEQS